MIGLGKKVLIANVVATAVDQVFALPAAQLGFETAWLGIIGYTLQIYFDFSGYSDMAIGMAQMFGFHLLENFNYPYTARSVQDFWRRWHISLSTWFRDYLYIPLGGSRGSPRRTFLNLVAVFFLCGLWHGAGWTFVLWGLYHGLFLAAERTPVGAWLARLPAAAQRLYTLLVVMCGWVLFRAANMAQASAFFSAMFGLKAAWGHAARYLPNDVRLAMLCGIVLATPLAAQAALRFRELAGRRLLGVVPAELLFHAARTAGMTAIFLLSAMWLAAGTYNPFIYFRF